MAKNKQRKRVTTDRGEILAARAAAKAKQEQKRLEAKKRRNRRIRNIALIAGGAAVLGTGAFFGIRYWMQQSGWLMRRTTVTESAHYKVDQTMFAFYYADCKNSFDAYRAENPDASGYDPAVSLKEQKTETGQTWYQLFADASLNTIQSVLRLCEAAYDAGFTLTDAQYSEIHREAEAFDRSGCPDCVTAADIERAMTLRKIAGEYNNSYQQQHQVTDADIESRWETDSDSYKEWSVLCYSFSWADSENAESDEAAAQLEAKQLAECTDPEAFRAYIKDYLMRSLALDSDAAEKSLRALEVKGPGKTFTDASRTWALADSTKLYDTFIEQSPERQAVQVYMMTEMPARDDGPTADLRVIVLSASSFDSFDAAKAELEKLRKEAADNGNTPEAFGALAAEYSEDRETYPNDGRLTCFSKRNQRYGFEAGAWSADPARKQGDTLITALGESTAILLYYEAQNPTPSWKVNIRKDLETENEQTFQNALAEYAVTEHDENTDIPVK